MLHVVAGCGKHGGSVIRIKVALGHWTKASTGERPALRRSRILERRVVDEVHVRQHVRKAINCCFLSADSCNPPWVYFMNGSIVGDGCPPES
jgi:hypothetical protein